MDLDDILDSMAHATGNVSSNREEADVQPKKRQREEEVDGLGIWNPNVTMDLPASIVKSVAKRAEAYESHPSLEIARQQVVRSLCAKIKSIGEDLGLSELPNSVLETWQFTSQLTVAEKDPLIPHGESNFTGLQDELLKAGATKSGAKRQCKKLTKLSDKMLRKFQQQTFVVGKKRHVKVTEQDAMVELSYGHFSVKLSTAHYTKLRILYERQQDVDSTTPPGKYQFESAVFCLLLRYDSLDGGGFQAALNEECFDVLLEHFECRMECFASPLNCRYAPFCSAFLDTDHVFGSVGSFFEFSPREGCYEANPPFVPKLIKRMADHMTQLLEKSDKALAFIVIIPAWKNTEGWRVLNESRFNKHHLLIEQKDHGYCEGKQHIRKTRWRIASFDTSVFFWQNPKAALQWPVTTDALAALTQAFVSKQAEERDTLQLRRGGKRVRHND